MRHDQNGGVQAWSGMLLRQHVHTRHVRAGGNSLAVDWRSLPTPSSQLAAVDLLSPPSPANVDVCLPYQRWLDNAAGRDSEGFSATGGIRQHTPQLFAMIGTGCLCQPAQGS